MIPEIPQNLLNEAYATMAERREIEPAQLKRNEMSDKELLAALSYILGNPLIECADLDEEDLQRCHRLCSDLDIEALREYRFIPYLLFGNLLVVLSCTPWDPNTVEIAPGYFPQATYTRFMLTSAAEFEAILNKLRDLNKGHVKATPTASSPQASSSVQRPPPAPPETSGRTLVYRAQTTSSGAPPTVTAHKPAVPAVSIAAQPRPAAPTAAPTTLQQPSNRPTVPTAFDNKGFTPEETAHLMSILVAEANKVLAHRRK